MTTASGIRYRLVTRTENERGIEEHVSSVVLSFEEAYASIVMELRIAELAGWRCYTNGRGEFMMLRDRCQRTLWARAATPFDDTIT